MDDLETTIRRYLVDYLADDTSLNDFTDWFIGATWNIEKEGTAEAKELAYAIDLALAEASSGLLALDELRVALLGLSQHVNLKLNSRNGLNDAIQAQMRAGSGAKTISLTSVRELLRQPAALVGTQSAVASW
jgi:hypothetical protein